MTPYFVVAAIIYTMLNGQQVGKAQIDSRTQFATLEECKVFLDDPAFADKQQALQEMIAEEHEHDDPVPQISIKMSCEKRE